MSGIGNGTCIDCGVEVGPYYHAGGIGRCDACEEARRPKRSKLANDIDALINHESGASPAFGAIMELSRQPEVNAFARYQKEVKRTAGGGEREAFITACVFGLTEEAGEVAGVLKKVRYHGHEYERERLVKEMGDVLWYLTALADAHGIDLDEIAAANVAKLRKRYPDGFDPKRSQERDDER